MTGLLLVKLLSALVSVGLAAALLGRDHGLRANRLIAAFLVCNGWWAGSEFFLYQQVDPAVAERIYRWMSPGWMPLGVLCMHASVALSSIEDHPVARLIPYLYGGLVLCLPFAIWTDFVVAGAEPTSLGWRPRFHPGMLIAYGLMAFPVVAILASWRSLMKGSQVGGQRQLAGIVFFGLSAALATGTITAVVLPLLRIDAVGISTALIATVGLAVAWTLHQHGHSLISPQGFAREILDTLEDGVVLVGEGGVLRDMNRAFLRMIGAPEQAVFGTRIGEWIPGFSGETTALEAPAFMELRARGGETLPIVVTAPVACHQAGRWVGRAYLLRDRREIVSLQQQLAVSARLAAVGDLSKSISQSIYEPVARTRYQLEGLSIDWCTLEHILELVDLDAPCREAIDEGQELIGECVEGAERVFEIVHEVGSFSEDSEREAFVRHPLDRIVTRALRMASVQAPPGISIEACLDEGVDILCHFSEIERVVTNLLVNSMHAVEGKPEGQRHLAVAVAIQGDRALLHVEDDGCGIEPDALDRIFDPFFTTKPVGQGTGLGLAISYHIVKAHGGEIRVSSIPDRGTSVTVQLPCAVERDGGPPDA